MFQRILIANRGEIALRVLRTVHDMGLLAVAVHTPEDARLPHVAQADLACALPQSGAAAYLDVGALLDLAHQTQCDAVHPGYGFLSERADFAQACGDAGVHFIGPSATHLALLGDKAQARELAQACGVPTPPGTAPIHDAAQAHAFFAAHASAGVMVKAVGGGGGRGMRRVTQASELDGALARCRSEAAAAFGSDALYLERCVSRARHIEIQVLGDGHSVMSLGERDCSLQRRFQKLVELAPCPHLAEPLRLQLVEAALRMARQLGLSGLATFEFLVTPDDARMPFVFIEANPRLQVEHTVTEAVTGLDLVRLQIAVAAGARLGELGLDPQTPPRPRGFAVQWRISAERLGPAGDPLPARGRLAQLHWPSGPGVRVDSHAHPGLTPSPHYDALLGKLVVHQADGDWADALRRSRRALAEVELQGLDHNVKWLQALAARPELLGWQVHTQALDAWRDALARVAEEAEAAHSAQNAQNALDTPLAADGASPHPEHQALAAGEWALRAPMSARVVQWEAQDGDQVAAGAPLLVLEAMKMEHLIPAERGGRLLRRCVPDGAQVSEGDCLAVLAHAEGAEADELVAVGPQLDHIRPDLQRLRDRLALLEDAARPAAVAKRHDQGGRTARENVAALCDDGSFSEYGGLAFAAQTRRRSLEDLIANTPADGMVTGIGTVNATHFGPERSRCVVMAYDYTVLAGTQGWRNHHKKDRMLRLAHELRLPVVLFAEGGGGRPGDVDMPIVAGLNNHTFSQFAALSGKVPVVGVVHGRCFAGNAALLGCVDTIIATEASNIGMGGPAMIEGGGLGVYPPEAIGPSAVQSRNGVIDVLVKDEAQAVAVARQYLSYFQGRVAEFDRADSRGLRHVVPENRLRAYDMRSALHALFDTDSVLELRAGFGVGILTALARIGGRPVGVMANNPQHLGGAIDAPAADKAARFMQLCDAHGLPIVSLMDTPGFMVGPDIEAQAQVRHVSRMFIVAAQLGVPFFCVVLRKGYGLGAQAMAAGGLDAPVFTVAWPTGEFGAMGLEGAVRLGFRKELEAAAPGEAREALFQKLVARQYENGQALNMAATLEIDAVIDPADTRDWLVRGLDASAARIKPSGRFVDAW